MGAATHYLSVTAKKLGISYSFIDEHESVLVLHFPHKEHFVINTKLGLISNAEETLGLDKAYQYALLAGKIAMPKTKSYVDPASKKYQPFAEFSTQADIQTDIEKSFSFPVIVKMNRGSEGDHVFLVQSSAELTEKIAAIFNQQDQFYDYVLLAQEYVPPVKEYRVLIYHNQMKFAYLKDNSEAHFSGNLSPLHWQAAKAVDETDSQKLLQLAEVCKQFFTAWNLPFAGLDIIEDRQGKFWLIEVNTAPSLAMYIKDCGPEKVIRLYEEILVDLSKNGL